MNGAQQSLQDRMVYTEVFTRRDLESMAAYSNCVPSGGFQVIDPEEQESA